MSAKPPSSTSRPFKPPRPSQTARANTASASTTRPGMIESDSEPSGTQDITPSQSIPSIPLALVSRLLHDHFKNSDTRITKEAMSMIEKYIETFMKEAVVRTVLSKNEQQNRDADGGDGFLEVEDLERVVLQLLLDF
ncbi:MAG: hypothetical protein Q9162_002782 [Coniocarpon cinnabarinum]